jgi:hypothetical protein
MASAQGRRGASRRWTLRRRGGAGAGARAGDPSSRSPGWSCSEIGGEITRAHASRGIQPWCCLRRTRPCNGADFVDSALGNGYRWPNGPDTTGGTTHDTKKTRHDTMDVVSVPARHDAWAVYGPRPRHAVPARTRHENRGSTTKHDYNLAQPKFPTQQQPTPEN